MKAEIRLVDVARWYGDVIALNGIDLTIGPGVVGLLGPNGAGKTTLLRLIAGLVRPTTGTVTLNGTPMFGAVAERARVGYCPEHDYFYEDMTGLAFVTLMTRMQGFDRAGARERAGEALERVGLPLKGGGATKPIKAYSKGMRQKVKIAQALAHDPDVIILDEPLTGTDPVSRSQIFDLCQRLGEGGRTVLLSSHVLHEVERVTGEFILIDRGRLLAQGNVQEIRELIDRHPHRIEVHCDSPRRLASHLVATPHVGGVEVTGDHSLVVETPEPDTCYALIPSVALAADIRITRLTSPDNNLEAVFRYLTRGK